MASLAQFSADLIQVFTDHATKSIAGGAALAGMVGVLVSYFARVHDADDKIRQQTGWLAETRRKEQLKDEAGKIAEDR